TVDVVIDSPGLSEAEAAQILDIVNRQTGIALDKIYISPLKTKN
ncbi:MAG: SpoIIIAH-like family protein, partial [Epulopiscium sp.]|nr:SpoIIIAH-like family protein [Candidatus Epulonipiscium sp.]